MAEIRCLQKLIAQHPKNLIQRSKLSQFIQSGLVVFFLSSCAAHTHKKATASLPHQLADLEESSGGRIGLSALNTANGIRFQYRADDRFPLCSTFKAMAVAAILRKSMSDESLMNKHIVYSQREVTDSGYAPVTQNRLSGGMSVADLCRAAIQQSDNAAANLLLNILGGPAAVTKFMRTIGDDAFRLDRKEPDLNSALPSDPRDTSTPAAVEKSLHRLLLGDALSPPQREQLQLWLIGNKTGDARIRAALPKDWVVGDRTGTCAFGTTNDIGIIWPKNGAPIIVAIYFTQKQKDASPRDDIIAAVTRLLIAEID